MSVTLDLVPLRSLADLTDGASGAQIAEVARGLESRVLWRRRRGEEDGLAAALEETRTAQARLAAARPVSEAS